VYTNPPSVLKYRPVLTANLRAAARLSNLVLFCQKHLAHCGCTKVYPGQHNIFDLRRWPLKDRTEICKLVTYEFHSAVGENTLKIRITP